jgi:hypothetical protein
VNTCTKIEKCAWSYMIMKKRKRINGHMGCKVKKRCA